MTPQNLTGSIVFDEMTEIVTEIPNDILAPERPFVVKWLVRGDPKIRGLRFEVRHHAIRVARGRDGKTESVLYQREIRKEKLSYSSWQEIPLNFANSRLTEIQTDILQVCYTLKITADILRRFDKSIEFPLRIERLTSESDSLEYNSFMTM